MKKKFETPVCEVVRFTWKDVIATSVPTPPTGLYGVDIKQNGETGQGAQTSVTYKK